MIQLVILDADGVLIHAERFSKQLERDYRITTQITEPFFSGPFKECLIGKADLKEELGPYLKKWGWQKSVEEFLDYWFTAEHKIDQSLIEYSEFTIPRNHMCAGHQSRKIPGALYAGEDGIFCSI
jgi:putative hydrolase of the HAD superfamily